MVTTTGALKGSANTGIYCKHLEYTGCKQPHLEYFHTYNEYKNKYFHILTKER